jgi:hypothetical protein
MSKKNSEKLEEIIKILYGKSIYKSRQLSTKRPAVEL